VDIRLARLDDAASIADIYNHAVTTTTAVFDLVPRTLAEQEAWLSARSGAHVVLVATGEDGLLGFASLSPYHARPAYRTTVESSVYVREDHQGEGIGRQLVEHLLEVAVEHGFHAVIARIAGDNEPSVALHESLGFSVVGREREVGRKFGRWLDVVIMERLLT
jgi:L-amino acid N-acyltransferase YncA